MALIIQKFGGTSVGSIERIQAVAEIVHRTKQAGHDVIVVVSAMGDETDRLIGLMEELLAVHPQCPVNPREYDVLVSTGEQVSIALVAMALQQKGYNGLAMLGWQVKITTDEAHRKARIMHINEEALRAHLAAGSIPVLAGFQGVTPDGHITTLGRGGSDTTAVAVAAAMNAFECQIFTDVDGVYTSDPRVVELARRLDEVTFDEMLELSSLGANVLQLRAVEFASKYHVPLRVLSSFNPGPGTLIKALGGKMEQPLVSGVAFDRRQAKITLTGIPVKKGVASAILAALSDANIEVDMVVQNVAGHNQTMDFSLTVAREEFPLAKSIVEKLQPSLQASHVFFNERVAKLSLVGIGMRSHPGIAAKMITALEAENITTHIISTSEIKISALIDEKYLELGARVLHTTFGLDAVTAS